MTTDRDTDDRDEFVSAAYRGLGDEKAPERLNRAVLDLASAQTGGRGRKSVLSALWIKPVAWAATIGLCLAIVLEYNQLPSGVVQPGFAPAAEPVESVRDDFTPADKDIILEANNRAKMQAGPSPAVFQEEEVVENIDLATVEQKGRVDAFSASAPAASQNSARKRTDASAQARAAATPASVAEQLPAPRLEMEIEELMTSEAAVPCSEKIRESADDWLSCILELRRTGFEDIANDEYEAFREEFPAESAEYEANK